MVEGRGGKADFGDGKAGVVDCDCGEGVGGRGAGGWDREVGGVAGENAVGEGLEGRVRGGDEDADFEVLFGGAVGGGHGWRAEAVVVFGCLRGAWISVQLNSKKVFCLVVSASMLLGWISLQAEGAEGLKAAGRIAYLMGGDVRVTDTSYLASSSTWD